MHAKCMHQIWQHDGVRTGYLPLILHRDDMGSIPMLS